MTWTVIESLPVHEDIKKQTGNYKLYIENYKAKPSQCCPCGLKVVTYNFMPILDWMRTDISFEMPDKSKALRFEKSAFIAFDLFLLKRPGQKKIILQKKCKSQTKIGTMSAEEKEILYSNTLLGLPGSEERFTEEQIFALKTYEGIDAKKLKATSFLFFTGKLFLLQKKWVENGNTS